MARKSKARASSRKKSLFAAQAAAKMIRVIERVGNRLPHPFTLFVILILVIFMLSFLLSAVGVSVSYDTLEASTGQKVSKSVSVVSLFRRDMLQAIMENFVKTFAYFAPVGFVIIMVLGVSLAEQTGFFQRSSGC